MSHSQVPDQTIRDEVLDVSRSFIVQAPAGSGKTELLSNRFLNLLTVVEQPEEILAITFTRKAAGEMRHRILSFIALGLNEQPPQEPHLHSSWQMAKKVLQRDREFGWDILDNPNRLRVLTIDALCSSLAQRLPLLSRFGALPEITDQVDEAYQAAVELLLNDLEQQQPWSPALKYVLDYLDNEWGRFQTLMANMLSKRSQWLPWLWQHAGNADAKAEFELGLQSIIDDSLRNLVQCLPQNIVHELPPLLEQATQVCESLGKRFPLTCEDLPVSLTTHHKDIKYWRAVSFLLLTQNKSPGFRKSISKTIGFPTEKEGQDPQQKLQFKQNKALLKGIVDDLSQTPQLVDVLRNIGLLPDAYYAEQQWQFIESLLQLLQVAAAYLKVVFAEQHSCDFNEVTQSALMALGDMEQPSETLLAMDYKVQHLLVDEYQDTNESQNLLIQRLLSGWQPDDGRSLFLVGDPMQSIYRFRDAEVGLFLHVSKLGLGDIQLHYRQLTVNFRSSQSIVEWNNQTFAEVFPAQNDVRSGAVNYHHAHAFHQDEAMSGVETRLFMGETRRQQEAESVAHIVQQRLQNSSGDIAILVRSRSHLVEIVQQLKQHQILFQAVDIDPLNERMLVQDLVNFISAIFAPSDMIAWFACLRAPWSGFTLNDLLAMQSFLKQQQWSPRAFFCRAQEIDSQLLQQLTPHAQQRLMSLKQVFSHLFQELGRKPLRILVEHYFAALGGFSYCEDDAELQDIDNVLQLLAEQEQGGVITDVELFKQQVATLFASVDPNADGRVQLMTIHKSKGLQFETVIVPGLEHYSRGQETQFMLWDTVLDDQGEEKLIIGPMGYQSSSEDAIYRYLSDLEKQRLNHELDRLLYVALTRAEKSLVLMAGVEWDAKKEEIKSPDDRSLLARLWPHIKDDAIVTESQIQETDEDDQPPRLLKRIKANHWPWQVATSVQTEQIAGSINSDILLQNNQFERNLGSMIHAQLQQIVEQGKPFISQLASERYQSYLQSRLIENLGYLHDHELMEWSQRITNALQQCLKDQVGSWILRHHAEFDACEYQVIDLAHSFQEKKVIDRVFVDQGTLWIIDYKTSLPHQGEALADFYQKEWQAYQFQLNSYRTLMQRKGYKAIKTGLYFPMFQGWYSP